MELRVLVAVCVAGVLCAETAPARADAADVEALITKGNDLRREGKPGLALPYFQKAYEQTRTPRTEGQLGLAELSAGYPVEAAEHLSTALDSPNDPWMKRYKQMITSALTMARAQIGEVSITGSPAGAEVIVNGHPVGALPLSSTVKLAASNSEVVVRAPGHTERREQLRVAAGQKYQLTFNLEPLPKPAEPPKPVTPLPSAAAPATPTSVTSGPVVVERTSNTAPSSSLRTAAWVVGGAAVAAGGAGLALNLMALSNTSDYNAYTWQKRWSIVSYISGGVLAVTSAVLFLLSHPTSPVSNTHAHFTCAPTLNGVACRSMF